MGQGFDDDKKAEIVKWDYPPLIRGGNNEVWNHFEMAVIVAYQLKGFRQSRRRNQSIRNNQSMAQRVRQQKCVSFLRDGGIQLNNLKSTQQFLAFR